MSVPDKKLKIHFGHGLGDCTYFAHQLPLYVRRGYDVTVSCNPDKRILFEPCGVTITHEQDDAPSVAWYEAYSVGQLVDTDYAMCNKAAFNFGRDPMPYIGTPEELWDEFCRVQLSVKDYISDEDREEVRRFLEPLPRPVVLVHTVGNSRQDTKSLTPDMTVDLYRHLLDCMDGSLVLLDWDNRVPRLPGYRVRHLVDDWKWIEVPRLMALIEAADLVVGIDSGPLHATRFTDTPAIGIFPHTAHYPVYIALPRDRQLNIVPRDSTIAWNQKVRIAYNIAHSDGDTLSPQFIAENAARMLGEPRYLDRRRLGADVQLQQFVLDWEHGPSGPLSPYLDRHKSFDRLLLEIRQRFKDPVIVETGCIRAEEDWQGAGYSTYLLGAFLERYGGKLISVDIDRVHCDFARRMTKELPCVTVHSEDSVAFLDRFDQKIDVLLLDSLDLWEQGCAEHALREVQAALGKLRDDSLIIFDDTVYNRGAYTGKGETAVPWLLANGWTIVYSGYQTILEKNPAGRIERLRPDRALQSAQPTRKLILKNSLCPGDVLMLTAAVRDLHMSHPGQFVTDVWTSCPPLWEHNPYVTRLDAADPSVEQIQCEYPLINYSNQRPYHMIHGFRLFLQERLGVPIEPHAFRGDVHLSDLEKSWMSQVEEIEGIGARFWIIVSGGKRDYTAKWWDPDRAQQVVDHFRGRIRFVQCGEGGHHHPRLQNVIDLVGKTDLRQMVRLMWHADGVICPVTMFMHLAAAVESKPGRPQNRPCVVIAGGREPPHWEAYPHHQFLHTNGALPCCDDGGCWKSRIEPLGDGDEKDQSLCTRPVPLPNGRKLPQCLDMITAADVIRAVEMYLRFDTPPFDTSTAHAESSAAPPTADATTVIEDASFTTRCPSCAAVVLLDDRFCGSCGRILSVAPEMSVAR
jgi:ADP-heptose:LPS heptosyltransferase